jgi:hypothetical protein
MNQHDTESCFKSEREPAFSRARNIRVYLDNGGDVKSLLEWIYGNIKTDCVQSAVKFVRQVHSMSMSDIDELERW